MRRKGSTLMAVLAITVVLMCAIAVAPAWANTASQKSGTYMGVAMHAARTPYITGVLGATPQGTAIDAIARPTHTGTDMKAAGIRPPAAISGRLDPIDTIHRRTTPATRGDPTKFFTMATTAATRRDLLAAGIIAFGIALLITSASYKRRGWRPGIGAGDLSAA